MLNRWHVVALALLAACKIPDVTFTRPSADAQSDAQSIDAAPPPRLPSCANLAATCGAGGTDSCCESPEVTGGMYFRGYDKAGGGVLGDMSYPATVSDFRLDKYEVTVGRFRAFVEAGMGTQVSPPMADSGAHAKLGGGWDASWNAKLVADQAAWNGSQGVKCSPQDQTWTDTPGANENRPMNCITWYEAMAFCIWDGGYLPTEAEWNYAATGGAEQRAYPWSSPADSLTIGPTYASYNDGTNCVGDGLPGCTVTDLVNVGTTINGYGRWGQFDLAGNVIEWTLDWQGEFATPCTDCANLTLPPATGDQRREVRGGSFVDVTSDQRAGSRTHDRPESRNYINGVRCARAP